MSGASDHETTRCRPHFATLLVSRESRAILAGQCRFDRFPMIRVLEGASHGDDRIEIWSEGGSTMTSRKRSATRR